MNEPNAANAPPPYEYGFNVLTREVRSVRHLLLRVLCQALSVTARAHPAQAALGRHVPLKGWVVSSKYIFSRVDFFRGARQNGVGGLGQTLPAVALVIGVHSAPEVYFSSSEGRVGRGSNRVQANQ